MFLMWVTREALIPPYFFATEIGETFLISNVIKLFPVSIAIISSRIARSCSGVFGNFLRRKSTSTVTLLSKSVIE